MKINIEKEKLENLILQNLKQKEIAECLNIHVDTVRKLCKQYNLKLSEARGGQNRVINHNPFENLNDSEVQYWLGFLAADGHISSKKYYFSCFQANEDRFHIINFRNFISRDVIIKESLNTTGNKVFGITVGHKPTHKFLINLGLTPKKSRTLFYNGEFTGAFLRGVFDGDGSCSTNNIPKITTGSELFRDQILRFLELNNIKCNYREKGDKNSINPVFDVQILSEGRKNFYDLLYNYDNLVCLERKRLKVYNLVSRIKIG